jgi:hypothetical protein
MEEMLAVLLPYWMVAGASLVGPGTGKGMLEAGVSTYMEGWHGILQSREWVRMQVSAGSKIYVVDQVC